MAKLVIFFDQKRFLGKLTKFFTDSYAYHVAWVDEENDRLYDMSLIRRRRLWSAKQQEGIEYILHDFPFVTSHYLERALDTDNSYYGFVDYILFALRPIYHLFGKSTVNKHGIICSEMCNNDLIACGYITPWSRTDEAPAPGDLDRWITTLKSQW